jgi:hypothetical protein
VVPKWRQLIHMTCGTQMKTLIHMTCGTQMKTVNSHDVVPKWRQLIHMTCSTQMKTVNSHDMWYTNEDSSFAWHVVPKWRQLICMTCGTQMKTVNSHDMWYPNEDSNWNVCGQVRGHKKANFWTQKTTWQKYRLGNAGQKCLLHNKHFRMYQILGALMLYDNGITAFF